MSVEMDDIGVVVGNLRNGAVNSTEGFEADVKHDMIHVELDSVGGTFEDSESKSDFENRDDICVVDVNMECADDDLVVLEVESGALEYNCSSFKISSIEVDDLKCKEGNCVYLNETMKGKPLCVGSGSVGEGFGLVNLEENILSNMEGDNKSIVENVDVNNPSIIGLEKDEFVGNLFRATIIP
ncbi:uncharacterized protein LOC133825465 [Humulus lupulus]|uniref:uncharacterized protein LOC133825465 n=1 Tax=Humulus lupulus TaxID=3486 RepID=UPI002B413A22|nr:uncharacterized protein LOC133825465 [Humulus lupulus]